MTDEPTVTLREHLSALREADLRFDAERDRRLTEVAIEREKALAIKQESDKTALDLARQINDLHLAALNGEQARLAADRERFLSRETYDAQQKDFGVWRDTVNGSLSINAGKGSGVATSWGVVVAVVGILFGAAGIILAVLK